MNNLQTESLAANVKAFCEKLSVKELTEVTMYVVYMSTVETYTPSDTTKTFIDEIFGAKLWASNQYDEIKKPEFISRTSRNDQEFVRMVRIGLLQEYFWRTKEIARETTNKTEKIEILSTQDKKDLHDILKEHKHMLDYQLEDEETVRKVGGEELVEEKRRHLSFIEKFWKLKLF